MTPPSEHRHGLRPCLVLVSLAIGAVAPASRGQDEARPQISATYLGPTAPAPFAFRWDGHGAHTRNVAPLNWRIPDGEVVTAGLDRAFAAFCGEALAGVTNGKTYRFEVQPVDLPAAYGLPDTDEGKAAAARRAVYVRELYGRRYDPAGWEADPDAARAFQVALWEVVQEGDLPDAPAAPFDLWGGTFQADYPTPADAPAFVRTAQDYLGELTGDDAPFQNSEAVGGRELVRLGGLASPAAGGAVPQSQFGLGRAPVGGGGVGGGPGGGGGGVPVLGGGGAGGLGGGGAGGLGGGGAGGFGGLGGGGPLTGGFLPTPLGGPVTPPGTTTGITPNFPPSDVTPTPTTTPPVGGPPTTPPVTPSGPPAVTPAPPSLVLGLIAAGLAFGRRMLRGRRNR